MATPARCTGSYAIQVIQPTMKSMHIRSAVFKCTACFSPPVFIFRLSLDAATWPPAHPYELTSPTMPRLSGRYDISTGFDAGLHLEFVGNVDRIYQACY